MSLTYPRLRGEQLFHAHELSNVEVVQMRISDWTVLALRSVKSGNVHASTTDRHWTGRVKMSMKFAIDDTS